MSWQILQGDCLDVLRTMGSESVQCCVTSPPYWNLRDYGIAGQIGQEPTIAEYVAAMVNVFREVRRILRNDGTLWLNLGDTYASAWPCNRRNEVGNGSLANGKREARPPRPDTLKEKDLCGIPWRVAFALQADGWYLRQDIIWAKPNPMPESVTDRCTKAHEYIFLLSKSARYYYDSEAIAEPLALSSYDRLAQNIEAQDGSPVPGKTNGNMKAAMPRCYNGSSFTKEKTAAIKPNVGHGDRDEIYARNKRSVWSVSTKPFPEAHFATFPPDLIEPCIKAGSREGDTVLDPFNGAGTTGLVATRLNRNYIGIELNPEYVEMAKRRIVNDAPLFNSPNLATQHPHNAETTTLSGQGAQDGAQNSGEGRA